MKLNLQLPEDDEELDLTPMIDCVFQLILFFMLTSSFIEESRAFQITLPRAEQATTLATKDVDAISVTLDGRYFWRHGESEPTAVAGLDELLDRLKAQENAKAKGDGTSGGSKKRPVLIRGDARCEYQQIMQVKNVLRLAGVDTIFEEVEVRHDKAQP